MRCTFIITVRAGKEVGENGGSGMAAAVESRNLRIHVTSAAPGRHVPTPHIWRRYDLSFGVFEGLRWLRGLRFMGGNRFAWGQDYDYTSGVVVAVSTLIVSIVGRSSGGSATSHYPYLLAALPPHLESVDPPEVRPIQTSQEDGNG